MRASSLLLVFAVACALVGCSESQKRSEPVITGEFAHFFVQQASDYRASFRDTNLLPKIEARWTLERESDGFRIFLTGQPLTNILSFLQVIIGAPHQNVGARGMRYWNE